MILNNCWILWGKSCTSRTEKQKPMQSSEMCRQGMVDYVVTEDMDILAFGCPRMIRTCLDKSISRSDVISVINLDSILENFNLSYEQFVDMCIYWL